MSCFLSMNTLSLLLRTNWCAKGVSLTSASSGACFKEWCRMLTGRDQTWRHIPGFCLCLVGPKRNSLWLQLFCNPTWAFMARSELITGTPSTNVYSKVPYGAMFHCLVLQKLICFRDRHSIILMSCPIPYERFHVYHTYWLRRPKKRNDASHRKTSTRWILSLLRSKVFSKAECDIGHRKATKNCLQLQLFLMYFC